MLGNFVYHVIRCLLEGRDIKIHTVLRFSWFLTLITEKNIYTFKFFLKNSFLAGKVNSWRLIPKATICYDNKAWSCKFRVLLCGSCWLELYFSSFSFMWPRTINKQGHPQFVCSLTFMNCSVIKVDNLNTIHVTIEFFKNFYLQTKNTFQC